jgi:site-specific DNA recombinase
MEKEIKKRIYCAIYTRKSTTEGLDQDFTSLDAQRESAESYINSQKHEGWVALQGQYDDGGFTGANIDRPALQKLLSDIKAGGINCVVVYKVDRLSRSLMDFAHLLEFFDKYNVTFVSVTQAFNTNTSMGRLTLNILLSFAQFEREIISERTKDKMAAARKKGQWLGGRPPFGYDVEKDGKKLLINQDEANIVREIFKLYLEGNSLLKVALILNEKGLSLRTRRKNKPL